MSECPMRNGCSIMHPQISKKKRKKRKTTTTNNNNNNNNNMSVETKQQTMKKERMINTNIVMEEGKHKHEDTANTSKIDLANPKSVIDDQIGPTGGDEGNIELPSADTSIDIHKNENDSPLSKESDGKPEVVNNNTSLGLYTAQLVKIMKESLSGNLNINHAAMTLGIRRRRVYDITNVLEGVGVIEKKSTNIFRWVGSTSKRSKRDMEMDLLYGKTHQNVQSLLDVNKEIDDLYREDSKLDIYIAMMKQLSRRKESLYCTQNDLLQILSETKNECNHEASMSMIAVRAPAGSTMEVPQPRKYAARKYYELRICNETAKIPISQIELPEDCYGNESTIYDGSKEATESLQENSQISGSNLQDGPIKKKRRIVSVWDDHFDEQLGNNDQSNTKEESTIDSYNNETRTIPTRLPSGLGSTAIDPIEIYHVPYKFDSESKKYVLSSKSQRISTISMMTDAIVQGFVNASTEESNCEGVNSCLPWLEEERGVSDFFPSLPTR